MYSQNRSPTHQKKVMEELRTQRKNGTMEKWESEWVSPLATVCHEEGWRSKALCRLYGKLNQITKFDTYPMHTIENLLDWTANAYFSAILDLAERILPGTHEF